jgi:hypothetical protein
MLGFGLTAASNVVVAYAVDAYRPVSVSCLRYEDCTDSLDLWRGSGNCFCGPKCDGLYFFLVYC